MAIAESGHSQAILDQLSTLETQRSQLIAEAKELKDPIQPLPKLTTEQLTALSENILHQLNHAKPEQIRIILRGIIHQIRAQKKMVPSSAPSHTTTHPK